jgi:hypothetical protein
MAGEIIPELWATLSGISLAFSDAEDSETLAERASASAAKRLRNFHFRAFGTETFSISVKLTLGWGLSSRSSMEPSELFLASAVTGAAVLIKIGAFILLGII